MTNQEIEKKLIAIDEYPFNLFNTPIGEA